MKPRAEGFTNVMAAILSTHNPWGLGTQAWLAVFLWRERYALSLRLHYFRLRAASLFSVVRRAKGEIRKWPRV